MVVRHSGRGGGEGGGGKQGFQRRDGGTSRRWRSRGVGHLDDGDGFAGVNVCRIPLNYTLQYVQSIFLRKTVARFKRND